MQTVGSNNAHQGGSVFDIPIPEVLGALGKGTPEVGELRGYIRKGMFLSPFVQEKTPSFHWINNRGQNCWHCFATGQGGGVKDLVMLVNHCSAEEAVHFLETISGTVASTMAWKGKVTEESDKIEVDAYGPLSPGFIRDFSSSRGLDLKDRSGALVAYGQSRGISRGLLDLYLCQVVYHYENRPGKYYTSFGFPNIKNGFTLSNKTPNGKNRLCTSCAPTFIDSLGRFSMMPSSPTVLVCEGFWDFLSVLELYGQRTPSCDVLVLNSLSTASVGGPGDEYMKAHRSINLMLDYDVRSRAGQRKTAELIRRYPDRNVVDASGMYADFKDVNDFLLVSKNRKLFN